MITKVLNSIIQRELLKLKIEIESYKDESNLWRIEKNIANSAVQFGWIALPEHLRALQVLGSPWVIGAAGLGVVAEFFADKIGWIDSLWDAVHTAIRPVGGALLALAVVDANDPTWQIVTLLLGGGAALMGHAAKAGSRAVVNASPEPFSNVVVSTGEDVTTTGLIIAAIASPVLAIIIAIGVAVGSVALIVTVRRLLKKLMPATG